MVLWGCCIGRVGCWCRWCRIGQRGHVAGLQFWFLFWCENNRQPWHISHRQPKTIARRLCVWSGYKVAVFRDWVNGMTTSKSMSAWEHFVAWDKKLQGKYPRTKRIVVLLGWAAAAWWLALVLAVAAIFLTPYKAHAAIVFGALLEPGRLLMVTFR
jgi:hypothetical protein